ncbi:AAA domain-containing protein [Arcicella aurantiaca]|uniref:AAA domain-containing protein n=1 Tax=Arcicella aurantiaca TaxID=591202 RepID=A0A316DY15_9BACT|nr:AAA domain-containing protein [Arcicella aurantiaca]PWK23001.1 AAA domain-containing protein [Arcicella aurantiaca]
MAENTLQTILKSYQKRLTNLTSRNKSLLLLSLSSEQFLDINELDFLQNKSSFNVIEQLIAQKNTISLCDTHDPRYERVNEVSKRLRKISRTEKFIEEERGSEDLYVGFPIVKGKFSDGTVVRCPLMFFPVHLTQKNETWQLKTREEAVTLNRSFLLAYSHFNQVQISDEFLEQSFEDYSKDSLEFRTQLYEYLRDSPLKIDFNKDLFVSQLSYFEKLVKADLELTERNGELKLFPQAVLGIFPQAGSFLVPDYEELVIRSLGLGDRGFADVEGLITPPENSNKYENNLECLFPKPLISNSQPLTPIKEENLLTPFAVDATQELALQQVKLGASLVVQGPPGTGKSQLICNLVADFTARGKKVLVVCQKRAALDVVQERLSQAGMRAFVGNVHDFKNDRKDLYEQILSQIEQIEEYQKLNNNLDSIFLDRNYTQESRQIDKISEVLQEFKDTLFDSSECGISVKELYLTSSPNQASLNVENEYKRFKLSEIEGFVRMFSQYLNYQKRLSFPTDNENVEPNVFWQNRLSFQNHKYSNVASINQIIDDVFSFVQNLESFSSKKRDDFEDLKAISSEKETLQVILNLLKNEKSYELFKRLINEKSKINASKLGELEAQVGAFFAGQGIEITLPSAKLLPILSKINGAIDTKSNALGGLFWGFFSKEKAEIQDVTTANGLSLSLDDLQKLRERIQNRVGLEKWWSEWTDLFENKQNNVDDEPVWLRKGYRWFERNFQQLYQVVDAIKHWKSAIKKVKNNHELSVQVLTNSLDLSFSDFQKRLNCFIQKSNQLSENQIVWKQNLSSKQIDLLANSTNIERIKTYLKENFELLQESDELKASFSRSEWKIVEKFLPENEPVDTFLNSLKLAWIEHIEGKYPILRSVSSLKISQLESDLQTSVQKKQAFSQEILLLKLREETYRNLEKNRLQNVVTYRDLKHQVSKKRKLWSVRKLISEYSEEVFKLVPCWLASPETVSAIFPLQTNDNQPFFDLIIFDEASQCFAEQGIPALFRGKQIVIAGDSKQLQPNDLYRVRFENETDDLPELEIDSLLDLACQYLPQTQLKGHYRSRSLDLIDFSNRYFYKNTLSLLPDFEDINLQKPAIQYLKVDGVWENNTNPIEAESVISLVEKLSKESPEKSIGIVTFNAKQQSLIQDLIEAKTRIFKHPLFIKNIENVQGDERDFIIFSVGYAPDSKGKMSMQFGSLNAQGGENRLNVAVTRAKEKVFVVSSILPNQLRVEDAQNEGPKLLKSYLEYALMVSEGKYESKPFRSEKYQTNWLLKEQLLCTNDLYFKELPFADLTVKNAQRYESLVLTDDDLYYESLSPKETFAYIPAGLRAKGWAFERIFSRQFWKK